MRAATRVSAPGDRQGVGGERSHGRLDSDRRAQQSEVAKPATLETTMQVAADRTALSRELNWAVRNLDVPVWGSGGGDGSPRPQRVPSKDAECAAGCEMALDVEGVENGGVNRQETLG